MSCGSVDVSFVIPTHNRPTYLAEAVESILAQTRPPREIIIVDNGTAKSAAAILAPFGDKVRLIHSPTGIVQTARNVGIEAAMAEWVALLDDDDLVEPNYLAEADALLRDASIDIIGTDHRKFRDSKPDALTNFERAPPGYWEAVGSQAEQGPPGFVGRFPLANLLQRIPIYPSTTIVRRKFALKIGGYSQRVNGIPAEDIEFLVRALTYGKVGLIAKPLVRYRLHAKNNTASIAGQEIGRWRIFEYVRNSHKDLPPEFVAALDLDLPKRRVAAFKTAFRTGRRGVMKELATMLRPGDWSLDLRIRNAVSMAPAPLARMLRFGASQDR